MLLSLAAFSQSRADYMATYGQLHPLALKNEPITRGVLEELGLVDLEYGFGEENRFFYGHVRLGRFHMDATFHLPERMERRFMGSQSQSLEIYNFSVNQWVKASIMPTQALNFSGEISDGSNLNFGGVHLSGMPGIKLKGKKSEMFLAIGPKYNFNEFINESAWGVGFKFRFRLY